MEFETPCACTTLRRAARAVTAAYDAALAPSGLRITYLTAAGEAAIEAALPYWRKAQERIAALVQPSAIGELANQLDAFGGA